MIAYAFPPTGGSGVQRSAKFAKYLPRYGWLPTVWTVADADGLPRDDRRYQTIASRYGEETIQRYQHNIEHYVAVPDLTGIARRLRPEFTRAQALDQALEPADATRPRAEHRDGQFRHARKDAPHGPPATANVALRCSRDAMFPPRFRRPEADA